VEAGSIESEWDGGSWEFDVDEAIARENGRGEETGGMLEVEAEVDRPVELGVKRAESIPGEAVLFV
jgi:hypothetical protein